MSLPIHLQSIKSSGVYRFVYDKSVISGETAETLRLLVGYSDKGPFNTPVYIATRDEFIRTYGNISKRLEKKGIFFHRLALQALAAGPILCMNLKPFDDESVKWTTFDGSTIFDDFDNETQSEPVKDLYDTNRFWTINANDLADFAGSKYCVVTATDSKDASCSIIVRKAVPEEYKLSIREWFANTTDEMPDYLTPIQDDLLNDYFADVYIFRGQFTEDLCKADGPLGKYFNVTGTGAGAVITLDENYTDAFGEKADVLNALANDPASNYIVGYRGTTLPFFKSLAGNYISLDLLVNSGYADHKLLMNMNEEILEGLDAATLRAKLVLPFVDETNKDMSNDVINYYEKGNVTVVTNTYYQRTENGGEYSYVENDNLTDEQKAAAVSVEDVPSVVTSESPEFIYTTSSETHLGYNLVVNPTASIKKKAVEMDSVPTTATATDPQYIKVNESTTPSIKPVYLEGYSYSTSDWTADNSASKCLGLITDPDYGKGLQEALTNRVDVEYHYLVDTFDTVAGPQGSTDKTILAALTKKKDNAFAILNFPKIDKFVKAGAIYRTNGTLDFKKVVANYPLPDDADGASWAGYFTQVVLSDGTVKTTVPSAGLVSNLYLEKWTARQPYYIVAGSSFGRLLDANLVGPDYAFSKSDRDVLEPYGINVIIYEPRRGTYINSEQTLKQVPVSGLSKIHIRELVIYLQDEIADLLESYRWWNNTQTLRDTVKAKADSILSVVENNGGVYDFLNVCDESNNTPETIDNEFLVLDTHLEPTRGSGKMVSQIFIYRTGEMRSQLLIG